jgi:alkylresorcinol/alkylpyrone synthase/polyketide synthase Type III
LGFRQGAIEVNQANTRIVSVASATPATRYTQEEILRRFSIQDRRIRSVFLNGGISSRHLALPMDADDGPPRLESQEELLARHRRVGVELGRVALLRCLESLGLGIDDVKYLCCVTTTGLLTPGFSALLLEELGLSRDCARLDVVGMGCNAGLNGLNAVVNWSRAHPGKLAILLCIEVCSAAYVFDTDIETAVVNSLFGDGVAAAGVITNPNARHSGPAVHQFCSHVIPATLHAMRFDWSAVHNKFSFSLDKEVPYVVGSHSEGVVNNLLQRSHLRRRDISHWIIHSGGKKVIDSIRVNLGLSAHDVRHTTSVLRDYGNLSSGSFLFSLQRLMAEDRTRPGDYGVMMTMGPGATIETSLVQW